MGAPTAWEGWSGPLLERSKWHHLAGKGWDPSLLTEFTAKEIESLSRERKEKKFSSGYQRDIVVRSLRSHPT